MISPSYILLVILGMFLVTFPVRFVPFLLCNRMAIPKTLKIWLSFVPVSVFAGLLAQIFVGASKDATYTKELAPLAVSCLAAIAITVKTKSYGWGMCIGFIAYIALTFLMG